MDTRRRRFWLRVSRPTLSATNAEKDGAPSVLLSDQRGKAGPSPPNDYGRTVKATLLTNVPFGVFTRTLPVVAPAGTVATMSLSPLTLKVAAVP